MRCVICEGPAEQAPGAAVGMIAVRCPRCGEFEVSQLAEKALARWETYPRLQALRYAQTNALPGRRPSLHGVA